MAHHRLTMALLSERPLHERVSSLRAFVRSFPSPADAADALQVSLGTLRRNTDPAWATAGALDVIEEQMPRPVPGALPPSPERHLYGPSQHAQACNAGTPPATA